MHECCRRSENPACAIHFALLRGEINLTTDFTDGHKLLANHPTKNQQNTINLNIFRY